MIDLATPVALTMGEPAGIGTEITLKAWLALRNAESPFFVLHDPGSLVAAVGMAVRIARHRAEAEE